MQLKNSTDYAIRIVCYLAAQERMVSTSELSRKLNVSANYVPKIAKKLKDAKIVTACECKLCLNGMPVPLLRNCYSIFNGTKYR